MKLKPALVVTNLEFPHFHELVIARAKEISVIITMEIGWIIPHSQNNVEVIARAAGYWSHS